MAHSAPRWFADAYRRAVIDMHIPDWDPKFLSEFRVDHYVAMLARARAQSVVAYAMSHVGLFNYPTKVGRQHRGLGGRNVVQEIIDGCHAHGIAVVLYNSLIFDRWASDHHADWRLRAADGSVHGKGGRHGLVCPNSPYRDYVRSWVEEECRLFRFDGIRFDMTFWPAVCYCTHCRKRFAAEAGGDMPQTVNWLDERWVLFQRKREAWLAEFAALATGTVRRMKPEASVEHQSSTYPLHWVFGVNAPLVGQNDFLQGDFYGDSWNGSFVRKLLEKLTPHRPCGFETSVTVELSDHTTLKSAALLEAKASAALADNAAFIFIDAVDPVGTLNPTVYERMGGIFDRLMPYYAYMGGERVQDVVVYYSLDSKFDFAGDGRSVGSADTADRHTKSVTAAVRWLMAHHVPFGIATKKSLGRLRVGQVLVLTNVNMMAEDEAATIREWVRRGGRLYASGWTSLVDTRGRRQKDFMLADVLGVTLQEPSWTPWLHYVAPTKAGQPLFGGFSAKYPAFARGTGQRVTARAGAEILATTTLPWPAPDASRFSSIHSNPPWQATDRPEVVANRFGEGRCIYCASPLEAVEALGGSFIALVRSLSANYAFEADAPPCVEITMFHEPEKHRYRVTIVNFQRDMPNIPVEGIRVRLRMPGKTVRRIVQVPQATPIPHQRIADVIHLTVGRLETMAMFLVETG